MIYTMTFVIVAHKSSTLGAWRQVQLYEEIRARAQDLDIEFLAEDLPKLMASMQVGTKRIREIVLSLRNFSRLDEADMKLVDIHEGKAITKKLIQ